MYPSRLVVVSLVFCLSVVGLVGPARATLIGSSPDNPAYSAKQIQDWGAATGSHLYWIDPDGSAGPTAPFQAYCDMITYGGGWTLAVNSLRSDPSVTTDLVSNTGTPGLTTSNTRNLAPLALDSNAKLRHELVDGTNVFDGFYTGGYHGQMPSLGPQWTFGGTTNLLQWTFGCNWTTITPMGMPWYYGSYGGLPWAIPTTGTGNAKGWAVAPYGGGHQIDRYSIYVRESANYDPPPPESVPEPCSMALLGLAAGGVGTMLKRRRRRT